MVLQIRAMKKEDQQEVMEMVNEFYHSEAVDHAVDEKILQRAFSAAVEGLSMLQGLVLTDEDDKTVGFAYITQFYSCEVGGTCVLLEEVFFKAEARGKGYGKQFIKWLFDTYQDAARIRLEVTAANKGAIALYEKMGFEYLDYGQMVHDNLGA